MTSGSGVVRRDGAPQARPILIIMTTIVPPVAKDIKELHMSGVIRVIEMEEIPNSCTQNLLAPVIDTLVVFGPAAHELMMDLGTRL